MAYYYSASQRAFYCTEIVSVDVMPADKVAVADEAYKSLMAAQNAGKLIRPGAGGAPEAVDQAGGAATGITHELTAATADTLGHVKIGAGVNVTQDGTISVDTEVLFRQDSWSTRIASTVYAVGDVVDCPHKRNLELVCTQAGTTDSGDLAEGGLTHGATVTDGSVKWKVRAKIKTINDQETDASGAVKIDVGVKTVNNTPPDQSGNVNVDISTKRDHTIQIANADLNTLLEDKTWACSGTLRNTPITCTFCIVHAYDTGAPVSGNIVQVCYVPNQADNTVRAFWRNCDNGVTFGKWSESGAVKTVNSVAPDTSGNVEIPAATPETYGLVRAATDATVIDEDADDAAITPAVYHDVSDFRHKNTAYALGDKVECMFNFELFLECTKAGTTSSTPLNTRTVKHGQVITDGTAEWTVRTHIRSINNAVADASGNITPEQTGCLPLSEVSDYVVSQFEFEGRDYWWRVWKSGHVDQVFPVFVRNLAIPTTFSLPIPLRGNWLIQTTMDHNTDVPGVVLSTYAARNGSNEIVVTVDYLENVDNYYWNGVWVFVYASGQKA